MKHRTRGNHSDQQKQKQYSDKLDKLFDISHTNSEKLVTNKEDSKFLQLQQESRIGCIGTVDKKLADQEKRQAVRMQRQEKFRQHEATVSAEYLTHRKQPVVMAESSLSELSLGSQSESCCVADDEYIPTARSLHTPTDCRQKRTDILPQNVLGVLDRTKVSIRKSTMIIASVSNTAGCSTSSAVVS
jgi:hypothetical protein